MERLEKLAEVLIDLLEEHECVVFPEAGAFLLRRTNASANVFNKEIKPSGTTVFFNPSISTDDGLLCNRWKDLHGLSYLAASTAISELKNEILNTIEKTGHVHLGTLGHFLKNQEGKLLFIPSPLLNFNRNTFGLWPLQLKAAPVEKVKPGIIENAQPILANKPVEIYAEPEDAQVVASKENIRTQPKGMFWKVAAAVSLITLSLAAVIYGKGYLQNHKDQVASHIPADTSPKPAEESTQQLKSKPSEQKKIAETVYLFDAEEIKEMEAYIAEGNGEWFITGGTYMSEFLTQNEIAAWKKLGLPAKIGKKDGSSLNKVVIGRFRTEQEAQDFAGRISTQTSLKTNVSNLIITIQP